MRRTGKLELSCSQYALTSYTNKDLAAMVAESAAVMSEYM